MKAVICTKYGPPEVLRLVEVEKPQPKSNEVLIRIVATTVHVGDTKMRALRPGMGPVLDVLIKPLMRVAIGVWRPRRGILGVELSGVIEDVGESVISLKKGDAVFCGTEMLLGAYAEYICLPQTMAIVKKPINMSHEEAAAVPNGGITALQILRKAKVHSGQNVLIYGASGSVGTFAVQLAHHWGARVTAVCSTANLELVRSLGAQKVIDYKVTDFTKSSERYDVIFDAVGLLSRSKVKKSLTPTGKYYNVLTDSGTNMKLQVADLEFLKTQIESGKLRTVIDRIYPIEDIVEAHRYVDKGHKKGHVIIRL